MFQHYRTEIVSDEALETLLGAADADADDDEARYRRYVTAEQVDADEDYAVDVWIFGLLDVLAFPDDDEYGRPGIGADDVLAAADECGLVIATVYQSLGREERVIELDYEAHADAQAWAIVAALPAWVPERYRRLVATDLANARDRGDLS
jgi:hypothetical protein